MTLRKNEFDSKSGILMSLENKPNLLVSFGGIRQGLGIPTFEFFNSLSNINCDKVFIRDFNQAWYQLGVDDEINSWNRLKEILDKIIVDNGYNKVLFLGNSMGGYGAMMFGTMLNVNHIVAFAPQTFINRKKRFIHLDFRWRKQMKRIHKNKRIAEFVLNIKSHLDKVEYSSQIDIYYSDSHRLDKSHAKQLSDSNNVILHPFKDGGHAIVKTLRDNGELMKIIKDTFE